MEMADTSIIGLPVFGYMGVASIGQETATYNTKVTGLMVSEWNMHQTLKPER